MTEPMVRLQDKVDAQNKTAESLRKRFKEAIDIAVDDGGFSFSEAEYFGPKALRKALEEKRQEEQDKEEPAQCPTCGQEEEF